MKDVLNAKNIIERNDAPVRKAEGLELQTGVLEGDAPSAPIVSRSMESDSARRSNWRSICCTDRKPDSISIN